MIELPHVGAPSPRSHANLLRISYYAKKRRKKGRRGEKQEKKREGACLVRMKDQSPRRWKW